jgi:hypothetical protein
MDFREKSLDKMMGSKLNLPRLQQKTLDPITKQTTQKANVSTIGTNPFKSDVLNRKYKQTVKTLYAQGNRDPLGNAYSAVSQYKDTVTAAYQHSGADPLKAAEDQYNKTMWQFGMQDKVQGKNYEDLSAMLEESRKTKTTDTAKQAFYTGLPEYLSSKYAQSKSYSGLMNDPKLKARYNLPDREPVQVKHMTDQEKAYWDEMMQNPETAKWAEYANKPMTEEARQEMAAYAASLAGQEETEETKWLEDYIKRNTAKGAQAWADAEPENQMAKDTAYFVTNQERYTGTPEEVWQKVQAARNEEAQKKADEMSAFLPQMQQLTQEIYQSGKNPLDYFMGGFGTQEQADMWQRLNDSDNPELAALTQYAARPWDETADAIISKYAFQPDTRPFDAAYAQANPAYMDGNYKTVNEGGYKSIQAGNMAVDREVYNALYELDPEEAERYRLYKTYEGHQLRNDLLAAGAAQTAKEDPVGATGASWFMNLGRGINYADVLGQNVGRALSLRSDRPIDYMRTADMGTMADTYQQTVASGIDSDFWRTMYGVGNSTVNTLLTAPLGPGGAAIVIGSQAAQQRMQELQKLRKENNIDTMTDADILMGGAVAGAIEYVFEKVSIGNLYESMNTLGKGGFMAYAKDILAQAGINGSEEAMTTIANKIYDGLTMGENSEYMRDVMYYHDTLQLDEEKAKNLAMNRIMEEVAEDAISGALQGLVMGGVSNTVSGTRTHAQNKRTGNAAISADTQKTIIDMGLKMGKETDAYKMASKMQGKKISAADLGRLMKAEAQAAEGGLLGIAPAVQEVQKTIRLVLEERGETGDLDLISGAVVDMLMGNQLEGDQMEALAGSDTALSYVEDALQEKGVLGDMEETETEADELAEVPWQETEPAEETEAAEEETEAPAPVNMEGLGMVAETEDGTITLRNEAGEETDLQDTDMDDAEKKVIAAGVHRNAALTEGMRKAYRAKTDKLTAEEAGDWAEGYMAVAEAAERGAAAVEDVHSLFAGALTKEEAAAAFEAGKQNFARMMQETAKKTAENAKRYGYEQYTPDTQKHTGVMFAEVKNRLNNTQQTMLKVIDRFAREYGMQVRVHDTMGTANGKYTRNTNTVDVALDAEHGALTRVVSHEMYHYLRQFNPTAAGKLQQLVTDTLQKNGVDVGARVQKLISNYAKNNVNLTEEAALEEITADGMLDFIGTEENLKALVKESRSTAEKISAWLKNAVAKLRSIMQKVAGKNEVVAGLMDDAEYMEQRSRMLDEAMRQAGENYRNVRKGLYESAKQSPAVQEYMKEMSASTNREQAQEAFDGLVMEAFSMTQTEWMRNNPDGDYQKAAGQFANALKRYARGEVFMRQALEDAGFQSPTEGSAKMAMLAYVGNQANENDFNTMREGTNAEELKYSMKENPVEEELKTETNLVAQIKEVDSVKEALDIFNALQAAEKRKLTKEEIDALVKKTIKRIKKETGTTMAEKNMQYMLNRMYWAMNREKKYSNADVLKYARMFAKKTLDSAALQKTFSEEELEIRKILTTEAFYLTDIMKETIAEEYGSVQAYMRQNFGKMKIRRKAEGVKNLTEIWKDLSALDSNTFSSDVSEAGMPIIIDAYMRRMGEKMKDPGMVRDVELEATRQAIKAIQAFYGEAFTESELEGGMKIAEGGAINRNAEDLMKKMQVAVDRIAIEYEKQYVDRVTVFEEKRKKKEQLRKQIKEDAKQLNAKLLQNTPAKHIPDGLKSAVLNTLRAMAREGGGVFDNKHVYELRKWYADLAMGGHYADTDAARAYDEGILDKITSLRRAFASRSLGKMNTEQLQMVADVLGNLKKMVNDTNTIFIKGRKENRENIGNETLKQEMGKADVKTGGIIQRTLANNTTPIYFFKNMGGVWKELFDDIMDGQDKAAFTGVKIKQYYTDMIKKYHVNDWMYKRENLRFESMEGEMLEMDMELALTLYATWRRETGNIAQRAKHLQMGGFQYDAETKKKKYDGVKMNKAHRLQEEDIEKIKDYLGEEAVKYADEMVRFLSVDMAALGNETSQALYGYDKFNEGYYFPYKSSKEFLHEDLQKAQESGEMMNALKGWGASRETVRMANNPVVVGAFTDMWLQHCYEMSTYNAFAVPVDNLSSLYNYVWTQTEEFEGADGNMYTRKVDQISMKTEIKRVYGEQADRYIKNFVQDVSRGITATDRSGTDKLISLSKKASVVASASVVVQQPSSMMRAMALISPKYFATPGNVVKEWKQLQEYSGIAVIKSIGKFDTGTGRTMIEWMGEALKKDSVVQRAENIMDKATGWAPEKADQMTWAMIWHAVKKEVAEQQGLDMSTEEGLKAAAKRFEEVISYTQVYDSVLSKSQIMRSNSKFDKMFTAFMAEPTISFNLLKDAIAHMKDKDYVGRVSVKRAAAAYTASVLVNAILKSLVTAGRDDDENKTYAEKYVAELTENFVTDWNPMALLPGVRDVISIFQGYDVERTDMSIIADLKDGLDVMMKWANGEEVKTSAIIEKGFGSVANLFGVPLRNIARDVRAFGNVIGGKPLAETKGVNIKYGVLEGLPFGIYGSNATDYYHRMADAAAKGDTEKYNELMAYLQDAQGKKKETIETGVKKDLKEQFQSGEISKDKTVDILSKLLGVEKDKAYWQADEWESGSDDYSKYDELYAAIEGKKSPKKAIDELLKHGTKKANIKAQITSEYKAKYIELYKQNKAQAADLKAYILTALEMLGYDRQEAGKYIDNWLKE